MASPISNRNHPSLANLNNKAIFAIGGREWHDNNEVSSVLSSVEAFNIEKD